MQYKSIFITLKNVINIDFNVFLLYFSVLEFFSDDKVIET